MTGEDSEKRRQDHTEAPERKELKQKAKSWSPQRGAQGLRGKDPERQRDLGAEGGHERGRGVRCRWEMTGPRVLAHGLAPG